MATEALETPAVAAATYSRGRPDGGFYGLAASLNRRFFAARGIPYRESSDEADPERAPQWNKVAALRSALGASPEGGWVFWLDDDAAVVDAAFDPAAYAAGLPDAAVLACPPDSEFPLNTGVMFVRNTPDAADMLRAAWESGEPASFPYEQRFILDYVASRSWAADGRFVQLPESLFGPPVKPPDGLLYVAHFYGMWKSDLASAESTLRELSGEQDDLPVSSDSADSTDQTN